MHLHITLINKLKRNIDLTQIYLPIKKNHNTFASFI